MSDVGMKNSRPLSPHIQIYKPILTMVMSILHRITGAALYVGTILVAWWLVAAAAGPEYFDFVNELYGSLFGRLVLFGFTWALVHHLIGGLRHFIWDMGYGFGREAREWLARATIIGSVAITILLWVIGYAVR
ncbi:MULTISPECIES: succinate dehydrogenase, cytochrome b556 subunit [Stappia]|uniref:Succinate dehydrogenase cytochrome b556 subunit n=1 Tax=Stappia taiwanensis TaxID=992267 RepID=A0A838XWQ0_9HYPH|nr:MULTISPECIES: succinate dehydrogenase, cytochrome b556 subunit [Stappia]MBA4613008.1 succinate dehydrogenase, cytochrome b556 subunit [Stappia taiwanensis]MCA1299912.1 succinate dehydrogenase, cytochrome b556 subunit [Stappia indica]GGF01967.1 succinate dehydrogenase membrane anchor subunit [Stappia taiwanensis]